MLCNVMLFHVTIRDVTFCKVRSHPLPMTDEENVELQVLLSFFVSIFLLLPFSYIPASFSAFVVHERCVKSKHLQLLSGADITTYWCATFLFDLAQYTVIVAGTELVALTLSSNPILQPYPLTLSSHPILES